MKNIIQILNKIVPKEMDILQRRYNILSGIQIHQPIGRRSLSQKLCISEKIIRTETEYLKLEGFILVTSSGMKITKTGNQLLDELIPFIRHFEGLTVIEKKIKDIFGCKSVFIVSGNADKNQETRKNIGKTAANVLIENINANSIIALTGGTSVNTVVNEFKPINNNHFNNVMIVPARGSLGNNIEIQANTLVSRLAKKINCKYSLLNIPDNLSEKTLERVRQEPEIQKIIDRLIKADILIYGIGNSSEMANRRNIDEETKKILEDKNAVAEAFGYYFNKNGEVVYSTSSIGIKIEEMVNLTYPIAVAGGESKAKAILAVRKFIKNGSLIIDEGAANKILNDVN